MALSTENQEIAVLEWKSVTSLAWPVLSVIFGFQALLAETPIKNWQIFYIIGLFISNSITWALSKFSRFTFSSTPIVLYLLISPIALGDLPRNSWMSIGLAIFAAVIYFSMLESLALSISVVVILTFFQSYVASKNLVSITDNLDISYLDSYFSTLWTLIMGIASIFIRRRYLVVAGLIQETVNEEIEKSISQLRKLKQVNEKDSRNLRLHGTVLNTLIYIKNLLGQGSSIGNAEEILIEEIKTLNSESHKLDSRNFLQKLEAMISQRALNRISVSITSFTEELDSPQLEESCIEIIRELILNSEKHTLATSAVISITRQGGNEIQISYIDNSVSHLPMRERYAAVEKSRESQTMQNLMDSYGARMTISLAKGRKFRKLEVYVPKINLELELKSTLAKSRVAGLNDFSLNYVRAGALVALLSLPGYFFAGLNRQTLTLTATMVICLYLVLKFPHSKLPTGLLFISALSIIPSVSYNISECSQLNPVPWIFNHILTVGFFAAIQFKNFFLKWLPILIFSIECIFFPIFYPVACQKIFLGSIPAIPLIIVLARSVLAIRKREVSFDDSESIEIARLARVLTSTDDYRENAYNKLLQDLSRFSGLLQMRTGDIVSVEQISLMIQRIQTFLVCSEHFDSELIRKTYELFTEKQLENIPGRVVLHGENFSHVESIHSIDGVMEALRAIKANRSVSLTVVNVDSPEFHFEGGKVFEGPTAVSGIPVFYKE
jgi:hypothetical protein